jgi:hypothetical protein
MARSLSERPLSPAHIWRHHARVHGLNVDLERVKSGAQAIAFLTQGSMNVAGSASVTSLWSRWPKGLYVRVIAPGRWNLGKTA